MKVLFLTILTILPAAAQWRHFGSDRIRPTGFFGVGAAVPLNPDATRLKDAGWTVTGGVGVTGGHLGILVDVMYSDIGLNRTTLFQTGFPRGNQRYWAVTLDPIVHVNPRGPVDFYITGGGGIYGRITDYKARSGFRDPFYGGDDVLFSRSVYKPGVNGGAGFAFNVGNQIRIFAEARYHHMFTRGAGSSLIPVTVGVRF